MDRAHDFSTQEAITGSHTGPDTALVVGDYPYGFRERTQIRYWMEYRAGHGFRKMAQTLNPKTGRWNKPKASTYYPVMVLTRELSTGHIGCHTLGTYETEENIAGFESAYASALTGNHRAEIRTLRALNAASKYLTFTVEVSEPGRDHSTLQEDNRAAFRAALAQGFRDTAN